MVEDDEKVAGYTGFQSFAALRAFCRYLGPGEDHLFYSTKHAENAEPVNHRCRQRSLPLLEELFMTLVHLRLGLMENDLAYRFGTSQPTVFRTLCTWMNFLYLKLKEVPLWAPKALVQANMQKQFKRMYSTTRVVVDATEIYIQKPHLPWLQRMTFSSYKNSNNYKTLVGISHEGVITFVSLLFPGSISDKELTRQSGILDLLEPGDSVMADRGFNIEEDLLLRGAQLNIPPFLRGKVQLSGIELFYS